LRKFEEYNVEVVYDTKMMSVDKGSQAELLMNR
jgi:hypothetical protein